MICFTIFSLLILYIFYKLLWMRPFVTPLRYLPNSSIGKGMDPSSIMIYMIATPEIDEYSVHSIDINKQYCERHGYRFRVFNTNLTPDLPINFSKIQAALDIAEDPTIKYIVHIDADAVIHEQKYPITAIINSYMGWETHIIMGEDCYSKEICSKPGRINSGVFIVRNTDIGRKILNTWLDSARDKKRCAKYVNIFPNCQLVFFNCVMLTSLRVNIRIVPYNLLNGIDGLFIKHMMQHDNVERSQEFLRIKRKLLRNGEKINFLNLIK